MPPTRASIAFSTRAASDAWQAGCARLAADFPRYQTVTLPGSPNIYHIAAAALKCGFEQVDDANVAEVCAAIYERAQAAAEQAYDAHQQEKAAGGGWGR